MERLIEAHTHKTISQTMIAHMSSGRAGRLTESAAKLWAVGIGRFNNNLQARGSPLILHYGISDTTLASQVPARSRAATGPERPRRSAVSPVAWPVPWESHLRPRLYCISPVRCGLRCHNTACLSTACSARYRAWLRIADVRPLTAAPGVTSVGLPSRNPHQGSLLHVPRGI